MPKVLAGGQSVNIGPSFGDRPDNGQTGTVRRPELVSISLSLSALIIVPLLGTRAGSARHGWVDRGAIVGSSYSNSGPAVLDDGAFTLTDWSRAQLAHALAASS